MEKNLNVSGFEGLFNYFSKLQHLKTIFRSSNVSNVDEYQRQVVDVEREVKEIITAGGENSINFEEFNQRLNEIISHVDKESEAYKVRKQTALMEVASKNDELLEEKRELDNKNKEQSTRIKNIRVELARLASLLGAFILMPFATGAIGAGIGHFLGKEYKKTAVTYNAKTREIIGTPEVTYENLHYNYEVIVKECSPWVKGEYSDGYTREVLEYKYDDFEEINIDKVIKTVEPTSYIETKETLDSEDSTDQKEVIVTEFTNDRSNYRVKPEDPIVLGITLFLFGGMVAAFLSSDKRADLRYKIKELREAKLTIKEIQESYEQIGDKVVLLQTECEKNPDEYLELLDSISPELNETAEMFRK